MINRHPRREFLRTVTAATAATALSSSRILGANDRIRLGLIGCGSRGVGDLNNFVKLGEVDVTALCDVYATQIDRAKQIAPSAKTFADHRRLLDAKDVDVVLIAVPDHWHLGIATDALNAGKDVSRAADAQDRRGAADRSGARQQARLGRHAAIKSHYLQAKREIDTGKPGRSRSCAPGGTAPRSTCGGAGGLRVAARRSAWPRFRPLKWRLRSAAVLQLARVSTSAGADHRSLHPLIGTSSTFMGDDIPISATASAAFTTTKTAARRRIRSTCCSEHVAVHRDVRSDARAKRLGRRDRILRTEGRLWITRARYDAEKTTAGLTGAAADRRAGVREPDRDHMQNFLDCVRSQPPRRRPHRPPLRSPHLGNLAHSRSSGLRSIRFANRCCDPEKQQEHARSPRKRCKATGVLCAPRSLFAYRPRPSGRTASSGFNPFLKPDPSRRCRIDS
jgi:hypothetical protein